MTTPKIFQKINKHLYYHWDFWFLIGVLLVINYPLFLGYDVKKWTFYPESVKQGEWWRIFTNLFAHITWYHLLLDGIPFLILYITLEAYLFQRLWYILLSGIGNTLAAWFSPEVQVLGLCGLSGITYGMIAISSLEMIFNSRGERNRQIIGICVFVSLIMLVSWELFTKKFPFNFLLFNMVGTPILVCHAGGILGAMAAYFSSHFYNMHKIQKIKIY